ncbi:MAG: ion transporter [Acidimicrobiales bacterium]
MATEIPDPDDPAGTPAPATTGGGGDEPADPTAPVATAPAEPTPKEKLAAWEHRTRVLIIAAAVLPLFGAFTTGAPDALVYIVAYGSWVVFAADLVVHMRLAPGYLKTKAGLFDLFLVVSTFPWFLLFGADGAGFTQLFRLARLERIAKVAVSSPSIQRFVQRLGRPVTYAAVMLVTCSLIVTRAEGPANGFANFGDGMWWGIVTLTTVGYGDLVPETTVGRVTASVLMISGIALLGTVAASLASLFRMEDKQTEPAEGGGAPAPGAEVAPLAADGGGATVAVGAEDLAALQRQVADLHAELRSVRSLLEGRGTDERG